MALLSLCLIQPCTCKKKHLFFANIFERVRLFDVFVPKFEDLILVGFDCLVGGKKSFRKMGSYGMLARRIVETEMPIMVQVFFQFSNLGFLRLFFPINLGSASIPVVLMLYLFCMAVKCFERVFSGIFYDVERVVGVVADTAIDPRSEKCCVTRSGLPFLLPMSFVSY